MTSTADEHTSLKLNNYYDMQRDLDTLYARSVKGENFYKLYDLIIDERNIRMAIQTIRSNSGSKTKGTDGKNVFDYLRIKDEELINLVKGRLENFVPQSVRRVMIPKPGSDKKRPLGIPTFEDRIIQQCFKQILEPITEAKFHPDSYGFRPLRSTSHAIFRFQNLVNRAQLHYVVDIDIKGFFDNIDHGKLLKQMYTMGIRDKKLLSIVSKMLKAEIESEGKSVKGTPQGGILSPLLANIMLNELDWWLNSQWANAKRNPNERNPIDQTNFVQKLKRKAKRDEIKLKEFYFVRYADDFKIFCRNRDTAERIFLATKLWLKDRLKLEVSDEKSKITNLRKKESEFLGFSLRGRKRKVTKRDWITANDYVTIDTVEFTCISRISDKAMRAIKTTLHDAVKELQKDQSHRAVELYNAKVRGIQNYYKIASHVSTSLGVISFSHKKVIWNRLKNHLKVMNKDTLGETFNERYGDYNGVIYSISDVALFPLEACKTSKPMAYPKKRNLYSEEGRTHITISTDKTISSGLHHLIRFPLRNESVELNLNRQSKYAQQRGKCVLSGEPLVLNGFDVHHLLPKFLGGTDKYKNLVLVNRKYHQLIHSNNIDEINSLLQGANLNKRRKERLDLYREKAGNSSIAETLIGNSQVEQTL